VLHSLDGYDEISLTGPYKYFFNGGERIAEPGDLGFSRKSPNDLAGGESVEGSAKIFLQVLEGKGTQAQNDAVVANAGMALYCGNQKGGLAAAIQRADEALKSGKALEAFRLLVGQ
jgi:anthranilate phosphoribosyltransferase